MDTQVLIDLLGCITAFLFLAHHDATRELCTRKALVKQKTQKRS